MKLTPGISKESFLLQFGFTESKIGVALNSKNEIVECIAYDTNNKSVRNSVLTSMMYNGWVEDGKKQSCYKYQHPKALSEAFKVLELNNREAQNKFLNSIQW